jgi:hypothetical protein
MNDFSTSLKNYGVQLNNLGIEIQNLFNNPLSIQNFSMRLSELGMLISNIGTQIFNLGIQINFPNHNNFDQLNNIKMNDDLMNNLDFNKNNYNFGNKICLFFIDGITGRKTVINTYEDITIEELLKLYSLKIGLKIDNLKDYFFILNGKRINIKDKNTLKNYGFKTNDLIITAKMNNLNGGP